MNRQAVRTRITLIATLIAAIVLAAAAIVVVLLVQHELRGSLDRSLEQRADQIEVASATNPGWAVANSAAEDRFAQVLDADGDVLVATANVADLPAVAPLPAGRQVASTRTDVPIEDDRYRVLVRRFELDGGDRFVVVGENIDDVEDDVRALIAILALVFPAAVIVLGLTTWWLVGRTLRPVERIRAEVAGIGHTELDHRVPVPGTGDEIDLLAATMNDMLARLEASAATQRRFVADVSHELRTPLTRLRTNLEVDLAAGDADLAGTSRAALEDTIDMQRLVDDLLFLARHDAGQHSSRVDLVDLDVVVDAEVRGARALATGDVEIDIVGLAPCPVRGDERQLARAIRNLLSNATRHANGRVAVELSETERGAIVVIDDDGPGIAIADRERVLERFVRLDDARNTRDGGTGLGLAIVRDIVVAHGGTIGVESAPLGGARFVVGLPLGGASVARSS